jgi:hypothetical protein
MRSSSALASEASSVFWTAASRQTIYLVILCLFRAWFFVDPVCLLFVGPISRLLRASNPILPSIETFINTSLFPHGLLLLNFSSDRRITSSVDELAAEVWIQKIRIPQVRVASLRSTFGLSVSTVVQGISPPVSVAQFDRRIF